MQLLGSLFLLAALVSWALCQSTTPFTPMSDCGIQAQACYNLYKPQINANMEQYNFEEGCKVVKTVIDCIDKVRGAVCANTTAEGERDRIRQSVLDDQAGVCGYDGTVQECGTKVKACAQESQTILKLFKSTNATSACPVVQQFDKCSQFIIDNQVCGERITVILTKLKATFSEESLVEGCDGACGRKLGGCMKNTSKYLLDTLTIQNMPSYCQTLNEAITCIKNIQTDGSSNCSGPAFQQVNKEFVSQRNALSDICSEDGKPTVCATRLLTCINIVRNLKSGDPTDKQCSVTSEYITCISQLPCSNTLRPIIDHMMTSLQTDEQQAHCPTIGSCSDRLDICEKESDTIGSYQDDKVKYCTNLKRAKTCFDVVRKDKTCEIQQAHATYFESNLSQDTHCAGSILQISLLLLALSILSSVRRYL